MVQLSQTGNIQRALNSQERFLVSVRTLRFTQRLKQMRHEVWLCQPQLRMRMSFKSKDAGEGKKLQTLALSERGFWGSKRAAGRKEKPNTRVRIRAMVPDITNGRHWGCRVQRSDMVSDGFQGTAAQDRDNRRLHPMSLLILWLITRISHRSLNHWFPVKWRRSLFVLNVCVTFKVSWNSSPKGQCWDLGGENASWEAHLHEWGHKRDTRELAHPFLHWWHTRRDDLPDRQKALTRH